MVLTIFTVRRVSLTIVILPLANKKYLIGVEKMKNLAKKTLAVLLTLCVLMSCVITASATDATSDDYGVLVDNSAGAGYDSFWMTSLGLPVQNLPAGEKYTIEFDWYAENVGSTNNGSIRVWEGHMSGSNAIEENDNIWFDLPSETGSWTTVSKEVTASSTIGAVYIYVGAGVKGYLDNFKIIGSDGTVHVNVEFTADDLNKAINCATVVALPQNIANAKVPAYKMLFDKGEIFRTTNISTSQAVTLSFDYYLADGGVTVEDVKVAGYTTPLKAGSVSSFSLTIPSSSEHSFVLTAKTATAELYIWNVKITKSDSSEITFENYTDRTTCEFSKTTYYDLPELVEKNFVLLVDTTSRADDGVDNKSFWFNNLGMLSYGDLPNGTYTVQFDVCPITLAQSGSKFHFRTGNGSGASSDAGFWQPELTVGEWTTTSSTFTVTDDTTTGNHILFVYGGFKGYIDNLVILDSAGNEVAATYTDMGGLSVPSDYADYLTVDYFVVEDEPEVELSDDYAIYQDSSKATTNYDTYFHTYDYSTYNDAAKEVPAGEYTVTMNVYAQSIGTIAYKPINGSWGNAGEQLYWTPTEDDLNKWVTVTYTGTTTDIAKLHTLIYVAGFKGYVDDIAVYSGDTKLYTLSFTESDNGKAGHDSNGAGVVTAIPKDIADAKPIEDDAPTGDYVVLLDNSANTGFGQFYLHEVGMPHDKTYPIGDYTVKFDYYPLVNGSSKNIVAHLTATGWSGDAFPGTNGQKWVEVTETLGEWQTISFDITTIAEGQFPWFYVGAGMKGYFDNYQIIDKSTGETVLDFSPVAADLGKTSTDTATVVEFEEFVEPDCVVLLDNSANTGFGQFYLHEVGMPHDKTYPIGDYTVKFDYYPLVNGSSKNIVAHLTATGWSGDAFPGTNGQKWVEVTETLGEWQTISFDITTIAEGQFPWFYVGAGMKGYFDNYQIIDKSTGETVLDFSPVAADLGKTSTDTATVVVFEEVHIHKAGAVVLENVVDATSTTAGTYDEVVYCTECNEEISRTTVVDDILLVDTTTIDNGTPTSFWFNELEMDGFGSLPNGTYTIQFDVYPVVIPEGGNLFHYRTGSGSGASSDAGFWKGELTAGEWTTTSNTFTVKEGTTSGNHILYVYGGFKGCVDNIKILDSNGNEVAGTYTDINDLTVPEKHAAYLTIVNELPHVHTAGDVVVENRVDATCTAAGTYDKVVYCTECNEEISRTTVVDDILLVDTTTIDNGTPTSFWFNELEMDGFGSLPNGTYTIQFDVYPVVIPEGGNLFHYRTGSGSGASSDAGFWKGELTAGEWTTTSNTFTVKEGTTSGNHILYVYGGFKGYIDNIVILDAEGNAVAGTFTGITGLTVPEKHVQYLTVTNKYEHTAGKAVRENEIDATCTAEGSYDEVVYCSLCETEISRTANTIDKLAHTPGEAVRENEIDATCTTEGSYDEVVYCTECDEELLRTAKTTPVADHTIIFVEKVSSTFETKGVKEHYACSVCGTTFSDAEGTAEVNAEDLVNNKAGDLNGDDTINGRDYALLLQYINGWTVEIDVEAADIKLDDTINGRDYALLLQYINGWDVVPG